MVKCIGVMVSVVKGLPLLVNDVKVEMDDGLYKIMPW